MPTYEYECLECRNRFDAFQSIKDEPLSRCETCGGTLRRVIGAAGIIFRGSGFYKTDYRKGGNGSGSEKSDPKKKDIPDKCASCSESAACPAAAPES